MEQIEQVDMSDWNIMEESEVERILVDLLLDTSSQDFFDPDLLEVEEEDNQGEVQEEDSSDEALERRGYRMGSCFVDLFDGERLIFSWMEKALEEKSESDDDSEEEECGEKSEMEKSQEEETSKEDECEEEDTEYEESSESEEEMPKRKRRCAKPKVACPIDGCGACVIDMPRHFRQTHRHHRYQDYIHRVQQLQLRRRNGSRSAESYQGRGKLRCVCGG